MTTSVEKLGVDLRTRNHAVGGEGEGEKKEVRCDILAYHEKPGLTEKLHEDWWDKKNSSTGHEPNDHFITEAYVEFTQESVTEQRFPEDFDCGDVTIGKALLDACRRRADHSEEEGLSSCLSVVVVNES